MNQVFSTSGCPDAQREMTDFLFDWMSRKGQPFHWIYGDKPWVVDFMKDFVYNGSLPEQTEAMDGDAGEFSPTPP